MSDMQDLYKVSIALIAGLVSYAILIVYNWILYKGRVSRVLYTTFPTIGNKLAPWSRRDNCTYRAEIISNCTVCDAIYNLDIERYIISISRDIMVKCPKSPNTTILAMDSRMLSTRARMQITINNRDRSIRVVSIFTGKYHLNKTFEYGLCNKIFYSFEDLLDYIKPHVFPPFDPDTGVQYTR